MKVFSSPSIQQIHDDTTLCVMMCCLKKIFTWNSFLNPFLENEIMLYYSGLDSCKFGFKGHTIPLYTPISAVVYCKDQTEGGNLHGKERLSSIIVL